MKEEEFQKKRPQVPLHLVLLFQEIVGRYRIQSQTCFEETKRIKTTENEYRCIDGRRDE